MSFRSDRFWKMLLAVVGLICGLILMFNPSLTARWFCRVMGFVALFCGATRLMNFYKVYSSGGEWNRETFIRALVDIIAGLLLIFLTRNVLNAIAVVCGLFLMWVGVYNLRKGLQAHAVNDHSWKGAGILATITLLVGLLMVIFGFCVVSLAIRLLGLSLVVICALEAWANFRDLRI